MTIAPWLVAVNAAHDPRPANGWKVMPSTFTATSVRGHPIRTTPSLVVVALAPAALPIFSASSFRSWAADLLDWGPINNIARRSESPLATISKESLLIADLLGVAPNYVGSRLP